MRSNRTRAQLAFVPLCLCVMDGRWRLFRALVYRTRDYKAGQWDSGRIDAESWNEASSLGREAQRERSEKAIGHRHYHPILSQATLDDSHIHADVRYGSYIRRGLCAMLRRTRLLGANRMHLGRLLRSPSIARPSEVNLRWKAVESSQ